MNKFFALFLAALMGVAALMLPVSSFAMHHEGGGDEGTSDDGGDDDSGGEEDGGAEE